MGGQRHTWIDVPPGDEGAAARAGARYHHTERFWFFTGPPDHVPEPWSQAVADLHDLRHARHENCLAWWGAVREGHPPHPWR